MGKWDYTLSVDCQLLIRTDKFLKNSYVHSINVFLFKFNLNIGIIIYRLIPVMFT